MIVEFGVGILAICARGYAISAFKAVMGVVDGGHGDEGSRARES